MKAQDYVIALKVLREIQRKQAYATGRCEPCLAQAISLVELFCPLDFTKSGGRSFNERMLDSYNGNLFKS